MVCTTEKTRKKSTKNKISIISNILKNIRIFREEFFSHNFKFLYTGANKSKTLVLFACRHVYLIQLTGSKPKEDKRVKFREKLAKKEALF